MANLSKTLTEGLQHLELEFKSIEKASLTIIASKCQFGMKQVVHLGPKVGSGTLAPLEDK